jgi:hypothetical protein
MNGVCQRDIMEREAMKKIFALAIAALLLGLTAPVYAGRGGKRSTGSSSKAPSGTGASTRSHSVRGYTTKRGTYVAPHRQTNPDRTQRNNYSTKGNTNPRTGKAGTKNATR